MQSSYETGKGRATKASNQNQSIYSWGTSSSTNRSSSIQDVIKHCKEECIYMYIHSFWSMLNHLIQMFSFQEVSKVEKLIRENEDMAGRYVSKIFCGERIMGLVVGYDNETAQFKV